MKILDFEIIDHGVEHEQYFQGCGVAFTKFDDCATGIGDSLYEALEDAAEQLATQGYELTNPLLAEINESSHADEASMQLSDHYKSEGHEISEDRAEEYCEPCGECRSECHYYASILVKGVK